MRLNPSASGSNPRRSQIFTNSKPNSNVLLLEACLLKALPLCLYLLSGFLLN